jgi:coatomer protein complex subunit alpha (xenin)
MIANKNLGQSAMVHETIRIKSGAWDDSGIFIYSTLNHIKYALPQGFVLRLSRRLPNSRFSLNSDNGIIKTLDQPVYLTRVKGKVVHCLDRNAKPRSIPIDPTEYRFKLALMRKNYDEVLHIIRTSNLVGQSIIAYLQKKGFPEVRGFLLADGRRQQDEALMRMGSDLNRLRFTSFRTRRLGSILLSNAVTSTSRSRWQKRSTARTTGRDSDSRRSSRATTRYFSWSVLFTRRGCRLTLLRLQIVEIAYQRTKNFDRLSFLYLITGNPDKLGKMAKIAEMRGDQMSRFHNALYLGNVEARISVLREVGLCALPSFDSRRRGLELMSLLQTLLRT